jgi:Trypsin-co-occurring domain 2
VEDPHEPTGVGLAEAIKQVRVELEQATQDGKDSPIAFQAGPVELEFEVGLVKSREVGGGFQLSVLSLGAERTGFLHSDSSCEGCAQARGSNPQHPR